MYWAIVAFVAHVFFMPIMRGRSNLAFAKHRVCYLQHLNASKVLSIWEGYGCMNRQEFTAIKWWKIKIQQRLKKLFLTL